jgi:hypothetical protein
MPHESELMAYAKKDDNQLASTLLDLNLPFTTSDHKHEPFFAGWSFGNPVLYTRFIEAADAGKRDKGLANVATWVLENIYLPPDAKKALTEAAQTLAG